MKTTAITTFMVLIIFSFACTKKTTTPTTYDCTGITPTYTTYIKPLMDQHCATSGCHSASNKADGKDLSTYTTTKSVASNNSFLGSIQHLSGYDAMPQGASKLSEANIKTISCWVQNSMPQ